jgi:tungstate transport system ATP-binding protein
MSAPAGGPLVEIRALRHRYGGRTVVDIPRLTIDRGETLGVIGPSGAGKTTLLRLLQGLETPAEGEIAIDGTRLALPVPLALMRRITTVFQRPAMLDRSVRDNVAYGMRLRGAADASRVTSLIDALGLGHLAATPARRLSGGEIQRVAFARALAVCPDLLLLDEPAANLDPANVARVESMLRAERERGTTIVLVTHNTHEARRVAHRTLVLLEGRAIECGPPDALFTAPTDPRTAAFLSGELSW